MMTQSLSAAGDPIDIVALEVAGYRSRSVERCAVDHLFLDLAGITTAEVHIR
jgi:hypothetical protein